MKLNEEKEEGPNRVTHGLGTYEWNKCYGMWFQGCRELHWGSNHTQWMGLSISIANFFEFFQDSTKCDGDGDALIAEPEKEREMTRACEHVSSSLYSWGCFKSGFLFVRFDDGAKVSFPSGVSFDPASVIFLPSFFCNFSSIFPSALAFSFPNSPFPLVSGWEWSAATESWDNHRPHPMGDDNRSSKPATWTRLRVVKFCFLTPKPHAGKQWWQLCGQSIQWKHFQFLWPP